MLQAIRDKAQGWIAWAIVILISVPFALWGVQEYLGVGAEPEVARVDGEPITERDLERRAREFRERLRDQLGEAYSPDLLPEPVLRRQVLEQMIDERVLLATAQDWGMQIGDDAVRAAIQGIDAFRVNGRFDIDLYDNLLRNRGMTPAMFEAAVRQDLLLEQLRRAVNGSALVSDAELSDAVRLSEQRRTLRYSVLTADSFAAEVTLDEPALMDYYENNAEAYRVPERVKVQYLLLDLDVLAERVPVTELQLQAYYEQHTNDFRAPEQRRLRHILITPEPGADGAAALTTARAVLTRLQQGEGFAALAAEVSDDPGSASNGGDLGWVEPGVMVPAFEEAAFALAPGQVSEPVRTEFGYHLIEVTEVRAGGDASYDSVRDRVSSAYRRAEAEAMYYDYAERLADLAFENPGTLLPAAEALDLKVQDSDWFDRSGAPGVLNSPKVIRAAFAEDAILRGNNSEALELAPERLVVLRVQEHRESMIRPFAEVRAEVEAAALKARAATRAAEAGEAALASLQAGDLAAVAEREWVAVGEVDRGAREVPRAVLTEAFQLPRPAGTSSFGGVVTGAGDYALIEVTAVRDGDNSALAATTLNLLRERLADQRAQAEFAALMRGLRQARDIEITLSTADSGE